MSRSVTHLCSDEESLYLVLLVIVALQVQTVGPSTSKGSLAFHNESCFSLNSLLVLINLSLFVFAGVIFSSGVCSI